MRPSASAITFAITVVMCASVVAAQPTVTFSGLDGSHVRLLSCTDEEFLESLDANRDRALDSLLKYAALLKNDTDKAIIAYSVRWHWITVQGVEGESEDSLFDFSTFPSDSQIPARGKTFVSKLGIVHARALYLDPADLESETATFFQSLITLNVEITAIAFQDGTTLGAESSEWPSRWKAYLQAERDILRFASTQSPSTLEAKLSTIVESTAGEASAVLNAGQQEVKFAEFFEAWRVATTYKQQYAFRRAASALILLSRISEVGSAMTTKEATMRLSTKTYPDIQLETVAK